MEKKPQSINVRDISSGIKCQSCNISTLCIPFTLNEESLSRLDEIIQRKKPWHKGDFLFEAGQPLRSLYAIRSGSFKTFTISEQGDEQITAFHLPGDVIGFDAIHDNLHKSYAQALETAMVCEIPYENLDQLAGTMPQLRKQIMRLMSNEINCDQEMLMLLNQKTAEERLATFLQNLGSRYGSRGFSYQEYRLTMTRGEIGNYLGLTVETISRLLSRFQKEGIIKVEGKLISILDDQQLQAHSCFKKAQ